MVVPHYGTSYHCEKEKSSCHYQMSHVYKIFVGIYKRKRPLGRHWWRWMTILKWLFKKQCEDKYWIQLA
jgi:hypothetical protein